MNELPLVCICLPTYNAAATVRETLESILAQTYANLVIHVSDNASTDDTLAIVESVSDARIHIHRQEQNVGAEKNFDNCIRLGEGRYTAIFHADDLYEPDMVAKQVARLEADQELGAVFTAATTIDEQGRRFGIIGRPVSGEGDASVYRFPELMKAVLKHSNFVICPSAMVRTQIYQQEIVQWRANLFRSSADLDVWLRIARQHSIAILKEPLMRYRVDSKQHSSAVRLRTKRPDFFRVLEHYLALPDVKLTLTSADWRHYRQLEINDQVWCAVNLVSAGRMHDAQIMLQGIFTRDAFHAGVTSRRGLLTLLTGLALYLLTIMRARKLGQAVIRRLRKISRK